MVPVVLAEDKRVKLERDFTTIYYSLMGEKVLQEPSRLTLSASLPFSCSRHCTPHPFPTSLFLLHAFLAYLPPTIKKRRRRKRLGWPWDSMLSLGMPPVRSSSRREAQQVPQKSQQCPACQPANPNHLPSGFLIGEVTKYLLHVRQFRLKCLLFAVKNIPNMYTPLFSPRQNPLSLRGN